MPAATGVEAHRTDRGRSGPKREKPPGVKESPGHDCVLSDHCKVVSTRRASLSISETAHLPIFSCTTVTGVHAEWEKNKNHPASGSSVGGNALLMREGNGQTGSMMSSRSRWEAKQVKTHNASPWGGGATTEEHISFQSVASVDTGSASRWDSWSEMCAAVTWLADWIIAWWRRCTGVPCIIASECTQLFYFVNLFRPHFLQDQQRHHTEAESYLKKVIQTRVTKIGVTIVSVCGLHAYLLAFFVSKICQKKTPKR